MDTFDNARIKWPYVTHRVDRRLAAGLLPPAEEVHPGSLVLARVVTLGRHRDLESVDGRRMALFAGDVFVGALGHRYATDQFEAEARCSGAFGHIVGIGGVCGVVVGMNNRMVEPTVIEWLGRIADPDGRPLHLSRFRAPVDGRAAARPTTILSLGASMNSGKTTTAAQMVRSLTEAGHRVVAAKITGTACRKDPNLLYDAGAVAVVDFTDAGWPSTAGCSLEELLAIVAHVRDVMATHQPEFVVIEIADGIVQRETAMLLEDDSFRRSVDAVTFAGPDALSCESGVRRLQEIGYHVLATAGPVANSRLGITETEDACGIRCLSGEALLAGGLVSDLRSASHRPGTNGVVGFVQNRVRAVAARPAPGVAAGARPGFGIVAGGSTGPLSAR